MHGWITHAFVTRFRGWDTPSRVAFAVAAVLMVGIVVFGQALPPDLRQNALIAISGLFVTFQLIFLYANRGMVSALTVAQRHYLAGDLERAAQTLEGALANAKRPDFRALTLLGNTYRQQGRLTDSHETLTKALQAAPEHHFPWHGFGRTLMSMGQYSEAVTAFESALRFAAPAIAHLDHAEALYRSGAGAEPVLAALDRADPQGEPARMLWAGLLRWRAGAAPAPPPELVEQGSPYWLATAQRFADTPYGAAVAHDLAALKEAS
jgi:tetratricopeptide (TPR) repeat protein